MEADALPRKDVQEWLSGMVCMKIDAGGERGHPLADQFRVEGFPTIVLIDPTGKVLYNKGGAPVGEHFVSYFAAATYNQAVAAYNRKEYAATAPHLFFIRKWFAGTEIGKAAHDMYKVASTDAAFLAAYEKEVQQHATRLEELRAKEKAAAERRAKVAALKAEADEHLKKFRKGNAFDAYRKLIAEYPDTPEADAARDTLRKYKVKWKEPR